MPEHYLTPHAGPTDQSVAHGVAPHSPEAWWHWVDPGLLLGWFGHGELHVDPTTIRTGHHAHPGPLDHQDSALSWTR